MIVIDTNVLSEIMTPVPSTRVRDWVRKQPPGLLVTTVITHAEIAYGIALLPEGRKRAAIAAAADNVLADPVLGRALVFDEAAARLFAKIVAARRHLGRPIGILDAQIAAITLAAGATLATRDVADFADCGLDIVNPWSM